MLRSRLLVIVFLAVLLLIMFVGMLSGVSISASLFRAVLAAVFFTLLTWGFSNVIKYCGILDLIVPPVKSEDEIVGANFDFTVSEALETDLLSEPESVESQKTKSIITENKTQPDPDFGPLGARQIDPQVEKIINSDPKRMAEIIKKMGFEN